MTGPTRRERPDDGVHARAVGQAGIDARARLVDVAPERRDDAVDDVEDVLVVAEGDVDLLDAAGTLDVDALRAVDHDLGDARVGQQGLDGPEARRPRGGRRRRGAGARPRERLRPCSTMKFFDEVADDAGQLAAHPIRVGEVDAWREGDRRPPPPGAGGSRGRPPRGARARAHGGRTLATLDRDDEPGRASALRRARPLGRQAPLACRALRPGVRRLRCFDTLEQRHADPSSRRGHDSGPGAYAGPRGRHRPAVPEGVSGTLGPCAARCAPRQRRARQAFRASGGR